MSGGLSSGPGGTDLCEGVRGPLLRVPCPPGVQAEVRFWPMMDIRRGWGGVGVSGWWGVCGLSGEVHDLTLAG